MLARIWAALAVRILAACAGGTVNRGEQPPPHSPHWERATLQQEGIDPHVLEGADLRGVTSVLVARNGRLVIERYYDGVGSTDSVPVFSITKTVVSALVGIAIADGRLQGIDERLADALPSVTERPITIGELLSMTAGYGRQLNFGSTDPSVLANRPLVNPPGTTFVYDSGSTDLIASALAHVTGMTAAGYAQRRLFRPLGIRDARWPGSHGGSGLVLRPRALLAFGQLYLDGGTWRGRRILPAEWVRASTRAHVDVPAGQGVTDAYGYGWWVQPRGELRFFAAHGFLGQVLAVFPHLDEVVLVTSSGERVGTFDVVRRIIAATHA
jgi:CubicO group peptidase (beta-lactamase class C family)